ncbi:MAG: hypothetical protein K0S06_2873 [Microvirga sp.]|jgi:hypothetical protein|nr:hypothetical protein [Microvirga sp.]
MAPPDGGAGDGIAQFSSPLAAREGSGRELPPV